MKIWMSTNNKEGKAKLSLMGYLVGLVLVNFLLLIPTIVFFHDSTSVIFVWFVIVMVINIVSAVRMGASHTRDNLLFLRDDKMALFVVDLSKFVRYRRGLLGLYFMEHDKERILNNIVSNKKFEMYLTQERSLHGLETEIVCIESMKERRDGVNIVCHVIYPNRNKGRVSYFVKDGYEDQESLMVDLQRRVLRMGDSRIAHKSHIGHLIVSSSLLLVVLALCVMSHPILGMIDVSFYFYFLGSLVPIVFYFLYIVVTIRRGL